MKNYSTTFLGIIATVAGPLIVSQGFSEACGAEIINWVMASAIPGLVLIYKERIARGDVTVAGFRK
jgi:hypothetical protein